MNKTKILKLYVEIMSYLARFVRYIKDGIHTIVSLMKIVYHQCYINYNNLKKLSLSLKNKQKLCILGNGSSLNEILDNFEKETETDYMVVNRFVLSDSYLKIKPKYYVLIDKHFTNHPEGISICKLINDQTAWQMVLFVPKMSTNHAVVKQVFTNKLINIVVFNNCLYEGGVKKIQYYVYKKNLGIPRFQNVINAAIYLGINLKYKIIELYGVEHSWTKDLFVNDNNEVCMENPHFFDKKKNEPRKVSEIQHSPRNISSLLMNYSLMFKVYYLLEDYSKYMGVKILNCTKNSFIDAFERFR